MIKQSEHDKAVATIAQYRREQKELAQKKYHENWAKIKETFPNNPNVVPWALAEWERDKERGIGRGMTQDVAIRYYLENLKNDYTRLCAAFRIKKIPLDL